MSNVTTVQAILEKAAGALEKTAEERDFYKAEYEKLAREADVNEVLHIMSDKGLEPDVSRDVLKADLMKKAEDGKLEVVKQAALMSGHGGVVTLGTVDDQSGSATASDRSKASLNSLLMSGDLDDL